MNDLSPNDKCDLELQLDHTITDDGLTSDQAPVAPEVPTHMKSKPARDHYEEDTKTLQKLKQVVRCFNDRLALPIKTAKSMHAGVNPTIFCDLKTPIKAFAITSCLKFLYVTDVTGGLKKFETATEKLAKDFGQVCDGEITFACCSKSYLFVAWGNSTKQFSIADDSEVKTHSEMHDGPIKAMCCSRNSDKFCFTGFGDGSLKILEIETSEITSPQNLVNAGITCIAINSNSMFVYVGFKNGCLMEFDTTELEYSNEISDDLSTGITAICLTWNNKTLFISDETGNITQFNAADRILEKDYGEVHKGIVKSMTCTKDNAFLVSSDNLGFTRYFSINQKKVLSTIGAYDQIKRLNLDENQNHVWSLNGFNQIAIGTGKIYTCSDNGIVSQQKNVDKVYQHDYGKLLIPDSENSKLKGNINLLVTTAKSGKPQKIILIGENKKIELDTKNLKTHSKKNLHAGNIICSESNDYFVFTADDTEELKQWDIESFDLVKDYSQSTKGVTTKMCATADNKYLFTTDDKATVFQFNVESFCLVNSYVGIHKTPISQLGSCTHS
jgi:hypothetical protein